MENDIVQEADVVTLVMSSVDVITSFTMAISLIAALSLFVLFVMVMITKDFDERKDERELSEETEFKDSERPLQ
jgi:Ca2+/Na+ antiporter